jgi:alpha-galactosidase
MLEVGNKGLTLAESRAHFSLWCIIAAPLIAGNDVRHMSKEVYDILTDKDVIAIDQDPLGKQGWRFRAETGREIWVRELSGGDWAVCVLNSGATAADLTTDWSAISILQREYAVRDVWAKKDLGTTRTPRTDRVESHDVMLFRLSPVK